MKATDVIGSIIVCLFGGVQAACWILEIASGEKSAWWSLVVLLTISLLATIAALGGWLVGYSRGYDDGWDGACATMVRRARERFGCSDEEEISRDTVVEATEVL